MKSVKPGRGPSFMGGVMSILVGLFGVIWTITAASHGGGLFALFGVVFVGIAIVQAVYNFKNATGDNRFSEFDITDESEEPDPLNKYFDNDKEKQSSENDIHTGSSFCPYCGNEVSGDFEFCNKCGKKLPD